MGSLNTLINTGIVQQNLDIPPGQIFQGVKTKRLQKVLDEGPPTVGSLLSAIKPPTALTTLLGQSRDGKPFLLEFVEEALGAILISGNRESGKTHHLQVLFESAMRLNCASNLQIGVLTFKPFEWQTTSAKKRFQEYSHCIFAWYDPYAEDYIQTLFDLAQVRRKEESQSEPDVLLILDDLHFIEGLNLEAQFNLHWLMEYGSQFGVWIVAAINDSASDLYRYWVDCFRTRIYGKSTLNKNANMLINSFAQKTGRLEPSTFLVQMNDRWMAYQLPLLGD